MPGSGSISGGNRCNSKGTPQNVAPPKTPGDDVPHGVVVGRVAADVLGCIEEIVFEHAALPGFEHGLSGPSARTSAAALYEVNAMTRLQPSDCSIKPSDGIRCLCTGPEGILPATRQVERTRRKPFHPGNHSVLTPQREADGDRHAD